MSSDIASGIPGITGIPNDFDTARQLRAISASAADLAGRFELQPLLERILRHIMRLLECRSGSICLVDEAAGTYTKRVDLGVGCQEGATFSLEQGATGEVVRSRSAVILPAYSMIPNGHIAPDDPRAECAVIGVPIRWGDRIVGSCVVFSDGPGRLFTSADAQLAELFASHAAIALANAELHAKATKREREAAVAHERERAVRDVYNTVGRSLGALIERLDAAQADLPREHPAAAAVRAAREEAQEALSDTRRTALGVGPAALEGRSLEEALRLELEWVADVTDLKTQLTVNGTARKPSAEVAHQLYRIAEEALKNVVAHARASSVRVGVLYGTQSITLVVDDDGRGFDVPETQSFEGSLARGSLGLHGMSSRVLHFGGDLKIESIPGWGTKIRAIIPDSPSGDVASEHKAWKVLVASAQPLVSAGLVGLMHLHEPSMQIASDSGSLEEVRHSIAQLVPDVVVLDLDTHGMSLSEVSAALLDANAKGALVVYMDSPTVEQVRLARQLGVRGYLSRKSAPEVIVRSIVAAGKGQALIEGDLYEHLTEVSAGEDKGERLTARELEVRALVVKGYADKQIATELGISVKTVEKHVGSLLRKTGATNRTMLASMGEDRPAF